jgi:hypothetical protein
MSNFPQVSTFFLFKRKGRRFAETTSSDIPENYSAVNGNNATFLARLIARVN